MNSNDEFESLIRNFKLDDVETPAPRREAPRRRAYDYEAPRPAARPAPAATAQRPARASEQPEEQRPAARRQAQPVRASKAEGQRPRKFQVQIDESSFNEPSSPAPPPPRKDGGTGRGGGRRGGNHGGRDEEEEEREPGGFSRWMKALIALAVVLGVSVFLAIFALASAQDLFGLNKKDMAIEFALPENQSISQIASLLKERGVIDQPFTFQIYAGLKRDAEEFLPGNYSLNSNMSYDQIIIKLVTPGAVIQEEVTLLFQEGLTLREIEKKLEENGVCTAKELNEYLAEGDFPWEYDALANVPEDRLRYHRFEGYFYPDTYIFYKGMSPEAVARKFFSNFNNKMAGEVGDAIEKSGMTLDEVITLASVIQKEAAQPEDMKMVSSVFHNRLDDPQWNQGLQSDVTILYVEDNIKPFLPVKNQAMFDAYNTYVCKKLPVGPVCNPGMDAIEAALNPSESDYYYFIADKEGAFYYAKTLEEHNANIQAAGIGAHGTGTNEEELAANSAG